MARGKHSSDSDYSFESKFEKEMDYDENPISKQKILIIIIGIVVVIIIAILVAYKITSNEETQANTNTVEQSSEQEEKMLKKVAGYDVLGKIIIDDIGVEQYILDSVEDNALQNGVGKLYGSTLNNYGNFCIAGHNYDNVFQKLSEM